MPREFRSESYVMVRRIRRSYCMKQTLKAITLVLTFAAVAHAGEIDETCDRF